MWRNRPLFILIVLIFWSIQLSAQEVTPDPNPVLPLTVFQSEPAQLLSGQSGTLSIKGENFTTNTTVRLVGYGFLSVTRINAGALTAVIPDNVPNGLYTVEVSDPIHGNALSPNTLRLYSIMPTATPLPIETPTPTLGQPSLVVRNYSATPSVASVGSGVRFTFEVLNQGNATAFGVSVAVDSGASVVPAVGQASATLPDLSINGVVTASLSGVIAGNATAGANTVPITLTYRDGDGKTYTSKATLGITVTTTQEAPQVSLLSYTQTPQIAQAGELVVISVGVQNTGTQVASQVIFRVMGDNRTLLAGPRGDAFPMGDIAPNSTKQIELPLIVSTQAKAGYQSQSFTIAYLQEGKTVETAGSFTVSIAPSTLKRPLLLLQSVDYGKPTIAPGERFTLAFDLANVGTATASSLLVTFGTVESTPPDSGSGGGSGTGTSTTTRPSASFAPIGSGGSHFIGDLEAQKNTTLTQAFIASATLTSGIYALPITVQFPKEDGTTTTETFSANVVVVAPPRLQTTFSPALPDTGTAFEPIPFVLTVTNLSKNPVNLTAFSVIGDNVEVLEGANMPLVPLKSEEEIALNGLVMPMNEGEFSVTVRLEYLDDLNQPQAFTWQSSGMALMPPPPPEQEFPIDPIEPTPEPTPSQEEFIGKLLLGFLGLGE